MTLRQKISRVMKASTCRQIMHKETNSNKTIYLKSKSAQLDYFQINRGMNRKENQKYKKR